MYWQFSEDSLAIDSVHYTLPPKIIAELRRAGDDAARTQILARWLAHAIYLRASVKLTGEEDDGDDEWSPEDELRASRQDWQRERDTFVQAGLAARATMKQLEQDTWMLLRQAAALAAEVQRLRANRDEDVTF